MTLFDVRTSMIVMSCPYKLHCMHETGKGGNENVTNKVLMLKAVTLFG